VKYTTNNRIMYTKATLSLSEGKSVTVSYDANAPKKAFIYDIYTL